MSDRFGERGGAYVVKANGADGSPVPIPRVLSVDPAGTLYIGKASELRGRVIFLKKCLHPDYKTGGHSVRERMKAHPGLVRAFPAERLTVDLHVSDRPGEAERQLLDDYFRAFGETPPLNQIG